MKLITEVVVTNTFPLLLSGRLYGMEPGDVLSVGTGARDMEADITAQTAQTLLRQGFVRAASWAQGEEG